MTLLKMMESEMSSIIEVMNELPRKEILTSSEVRADTYTSMQRLGYIFVY